MTKRRTKPTKRIWAVWYRHNRGWYLEEIERFNTKWEAVMWAKARPFLISEIVCYERKAK